ncbi:MAG: DUF6497 family protein [Sulfitobacter sp.]
MRLVATLICATLATPLAALDVPSGQPLDLREVLIDTVNTETWVRFRFVAPQIARGTGSVTFEDAEADMAHLCDAVALPYLHEYDLAGEVVVVSLSDRPMEFGSADPDATQFIEVFRVETGACVWEGL